MDKPPYVPRPRESRSLRRSLRISCRWDCFVAIIPQLGSEHRIVAMGTVGEVHADEGHAHHERRVVPKMGSESESKTKATLTLKSSIDSQQALI